MLFEPVFPDIGRPGMCLRDYITINSMAALLCSDPQATRDFNAIAVAAYKAADAVLEARKPAPPDWLRVGRS